MTTPGPEEFDRLVHEPSRLVLMANLYVVEEADFLYMTRQTGMTAGNISSHMAKLEDAGYVHVRKEFRDKRPRTIYKLTAAGRRAFDTHRDRLSALLGS